nr:hypothetical protein [Niastella vici]
MDKLVAWGLGNEKAAKKSCPNCGMSKSTPNKHCVKDGKGCCKDTQKQIKLENDQKLTEASIFLSPTSANAIIYTISDYSFEYVSSITEKYPVTHAPPRTGYAPLFVRNCVFRI